jgi:4-carboxymuconolactone decarboxylase
MRISANGIPDQPAPSIGIHRSTDMDRNDIDPHSRCRLPFVDRDALDPETRAMFDAHQKGGSHTLRGLRGPGGIKLHSPTLAKHARPVGRYLRAEAGFSGRVREVAILITARCCDSQFEWTAHEPEAIRQGVPRETIEAIRLNGPVDGLDATDALIITLGREALQQRKVRPETYRRALETFGVRRLVDLVALMGNYASTAVLLTVFDMQLDKGVEPPLPVAKR